MANPKFDISEIISHLITVKSDKKYWFVRTMGGEYYDNFIDGNYVAIGYDKISLYDISQSKNKDFFDEEKLGKIILKAFPDEQRPKYIATQLFDFVYFIKKGDLVVIPSETSNVFSFAEVSDSAAYLQTKPDNCPFKKRKRVTYIKKNVPLNSLDTLFYKLKYTQRTVSHIDEEIIPYIDAIINTIFVKNDNAHLALELRQKTAIKATSLFETWLDIFNISENFAKDNGIDFTKEDFQIKITLHSPGWIEFISYSIEGIILISVILASLIGASFKAKHNNFGIEFNTEGFLKKYSDYLNDKVDRKLKEKIINKLDEMDIRTEDIRKLLQQVAKKIEDKKPQ